ncbi:MAG: hypothetical protein ACJA0N_001053 [Pseudohongiellaceae bacterium]|jgi:hypothetical protein
MEKLKILILGGYGNFGKRICHSLATLDDVSLIIAGRNLSKATTQCAALCEQYPNLTTLPTAIDIKSPELNAIIGDLNPYLVIHTSGPFQGQSYAVPKACISAGAHYIDLADDRRFVCDISELDQQAKDSGVLLVSGASSVPGLSSTVIDHFAPQFKQLESIEYAIAPGNKLERGYATIKAILSYTGHPFKSWKDGKWQAIYGWMNSTKVDLGAPIGKRLVANIDVPDLELFPERYTPVQTVQFKAGLELGVLHNMMFVMAWLAKKRIVKNWAAYTGFALTTSKWFYFLGSDIGGMMIKLSGTGENGEPKKVTWTLIAENGVGPFIPTLPAILVTKKLIKQEIKECGAQPCLGLFTLEEFMALAKNWDIYQQIK